MVNMVLKPFTIRNFKKSQPFFNSCECLLSKYIGNSDSQNDNRDNRKYSSREIDVIKWFCIC